jgi:hypothetical protein
VPVTWGVMTRGEKPFLLQYRAIGVIDLDRLASVKFDDSEVTGPLLHFQPLSQPKNGWLVRARQGQTALHKSTIKVVGGRVPFELLTNDDGTSEWLPDEAIDYGLYVTTSTPISGVLKDQPNEETRIYNTISVRITDDLLDASPSGSATGSGIVETISHAELGQSLPDLPFGITSFGAAQVGSVIHVYGGHTGSAHSYWNTSQSNQLLAWDTASEEAAWEVVSEGTHRLQGTALVSHKEKLILVGGFNALNEEGAPHDLHSRADVFAFDTKSKQWLQLPSLPEGRSSHDAIVLNDRLYVVGGWCMTGPESTVWLESAVVLDLSEAEAGWSQLPAPNFQRRALALAAHNGQLWAIGGMERTGGPTKATSVYDPDRREWQAGPELVGEQAMVGFGAAAWELSDRLLVTAYDGSVQVLARDSSRWEVAGATEDARFFHRMLPLQDGQLVLLGGANMESGKFLTPEVIRMTTPASVKER